MFLVNVTMQYHSVHLHLVLRLITCFLLARTIHAQNLTPSDMPRVLYETPYTQPALTAEPLQANSRKIENVRILARPPVLKRRSTAENILLFTADGMRFRFSLEPSFLVLPQVAANFKSKDNSNHTQPSTLQGADSWKRGVLVNVTDAVSGKPQAEYTLNPDKDIGQFKFKTLSNGILDSSQFKGVFYYHGRLWKIRPKKQNRSKAETANRELLHPAELTMQLEQIRAASYLPTGRDNSRSCGTLSNIRPRRDRIGLSLSSSASQLRVMNLSAQTFIYDCPKLKRAMYVGIVLDCNYLSKYGSEQAARSKVLSNFQKVALLFDATFNIQLGIQEIVALPNCNEGGAFNRPCESTYSQITRLSDFSRWRDTRGGDAGVWHLYTTCREGSSIGLAWRESICLSKSQVQVESGTTFYIAGTSLTAVNTSSRDADEWLTTAHELGHNFGSQHDCDDEEACRVFECCPCTQNSCSLCNYGNLMHPSLNYNNMTFSTCTKNQVCNFIAMEGYKCLYDPGSLPVIASGVCGNGVVEAGEDCDCGSTSACPSDSCCETNCKFKSGAVCDDSISPCCTNCNITPQEINKICRQSVDECDLPEKCDGLSVKCPNDKYYENGRSCQIPNTSLTNGTCATGRCTSRDYQCQLLNNSVMINMGGQQTRVSFVSDCSAMMHTGCEIVCNYASATRQMSNCVSVQGKFFRDGSPCGASGFCDNGVCQRQSTWGLVTQWIQDHSVIFVFVVGLIIAALITLIVFVFRRMRVGSRNLGRAPRHAVPVSSTAGISTL